MNSLTHPTPASSMNQYPPQQPPMDDDFIDLGRLFRAVMRHKWGILGLAFAITLATGLMVFSMQPVYQASASIVLESEEANVVNVEQVYSLGTGRWEYTQTQFEILKSRSLAERVVRKLRLYEHPEFLPKQEEVEEPWFDFDFSALLPASQKEPPPPELTEEEKREQLIQSITDVVAGGLTVTPVEYSFMVYLGFESTNPYLAAQIVNAIAQEFIDSNLETRLSGTVQASGWLNERLAELKENLRVSEVALQDFREREGLVSVEGVTGLGGNELKILSQRLEDARKARIEAQNIKEDVQGMQNPTTEELMTVPAVMQHPVISELTAQQSAAERKVAELSKRYGPRHPKMIAARSDLNTADEELASEVRKVVSGINREYEIARRNEQQLQATWEASKTEVQDFNRKEFQLQELQREVDTNRELYDIFFTRMKSVSETGGFEKPHARIVDRAMVPTYPVKPNKRLSVTLAFILGIMLGCGIAILLDMLDNTVKNPDEVQEKLRVPLLGTLPKMKTNKKGQFQQFWQKPQGPFAEALRTVRTGVVLSSLDKPAKIIVVTSTIPGEGKSTVALNLGAALAQMENTLVIGADLRRPSLAKKCKLTPNHPGLTHFVAGTAKLEDCIEHLPELNLYVMPAGIIPPNPLEIISSKKFVQALQFLRERFDRIVIDSAPVQAVSDALILASNADSVIYVVKADATSATQAQKGIAGIVASNEPFTGVVLNMFDPKKAHGYFGYKYYNYHNYYEPTETL
ncbi:MAG: polysaccharide biosynthesis tyrosine autokinase [Pseudomonadales bacterium]|nr:polysaccharide biosynthesis tyrosine autokinase [Pseudomonadales bacterium]